jgi:hypothetical protein
VILAGLKLARKVTDKALKPLRSSAGMSTSKRAFRTLALNVTSIGAWDAATGSAPKTAVPVGNTSCGRASSRPWPTVR